jgi:hypothetical protein
MLHRKLLITPFVEVFATNNIALELWTKVMHSFCHKGVYLDKCLNFLLMSFGT